MINYFFRFAAMLVTFVFAVIGGVILSIIRFRHPNNLMVVANWYGRTSLALMGIKLSVKNPEGLQKYRPCIFVSNHQSNWDVPLHAALVPPATFALGKKELMYIPLFNLIFWITGNIFLHRQDKTKAREGIQLAAKQINERNISIIVFPEGTRSKGRGLLPFKKGAFHLARASGKPIVPYVCSPLSALIDDKTFKMRKGTLQVEVLEPIYPEKYSMDQLLEITRAKMVEGLARVQTQVKS